MQISFKTHRILKWLERELVAVLAIGFVGLGSWLAMASSSSVVDTSLEIVASGSPTITVTSPNGGESWEIGSVHNVTWTSSGSVTDVKIELQRAVAGSWETIVVSTTNDGSYPWTVTGSATTTATIRISKVGDASVNDTSDAVFSITAAVTTPTSGGGGGDTPFVPAIDNVTPSQFSNQTDTILKVKGINFAYNVKFYLNKINIPVSSYIGETSVELLVPAGMTAGKYQMSVYNTPTMGTTWGRLVEITKPVDFYAAKLVGQSTTAVTLQVGQTATVWVEYQNTGTLTWYNYGKNPVRLGTSNPRDRRSDFRSGWSPYNRPAKVMLNGVASSRSVVKPGEIGRFTFKVKAPKYDGHYIEKFETVVEHIQWMSGASKLEIDVVAKPSKTTVKKPSSGGVALPTISLPETPTTFYDGFETFLRGFLNVFDRLIDRVGRI